MSVLSIDLERATRMGSFRTATIVLEVLASSGIDISPILQPRRFSSLADFTRTGPALPEGALKQIAFHAIDELSTIVRTRDGLESPRHADWKLLVHCLLSCRSLREAVLRMNDFFIAIDGRCGFTRLQAHHPGQAELRFQCLHKSTDSLTLLLDVIGMANIFGLMRWLVGDAIPVTKVVLPYPDACNHDWVEFFLPFPISRAGEDSAICFPVEFLDHPVMRTGSDYEEHSVDFIADTRENAPSDDLQDQARLLVYSALRQEGALISLDTLAERLGKNRETVRRQLKRLGTSYSAIKNSCRRELGLSLLRRTDMRIDEVAVRLDFCDSDAFRCAVHEWVGMSPSEYRRIGSSL